MRRWCVGLCCGVGVSLLAGVPPPNFAVGNAAPAVEADGQSGGASASTVWIMTHNIHHGAGNDDCSSPAPPSGTPPGSDCGLNLERIAATIRDQNVAIVGRQEVDRFWGRADTRNEQRGLLLARIRAGDVRLQFYNTHLHTTEADRRLPGWRPAPDQDSPHRPCPRARRH